MRAAAAPSVLVAAARTRRTLRSQARSAAQFDASRYFRATGTLRFLNIGTPTVRQLGRAVARDHRGDWTVRDALAFADLLIRDRHLEVKGAGIETLACFHRAFEPAMLSVWKSWLAGGWSGNWATTDAICGMLIAPLLRAQPAEAARLRPWVDHRSLWVRRASAVGLVALARRGLALDQAYATAAALHGDPEDLIQKAVGWLLREAGTTDAARLSRYLREHGPSIPRTTVRYAIERFPPPVRRTLLLATRADSRSGAGKTATGRATKVR
jgi:3-methyladenine DNA glycosylase AlkD